MRTLKQKMVHLGIIGVFVALYFLVATISMINSVEFFDLAHGRTMSWSLALGFELGAAASLAAIVILHKTNRTMVWFLFLLLTAFQMMANSYHAFANLENYMDWIELFGLENEEPLFQKRLLAIVSGAVLPVVALGFIKSLIDYIRPDTEEFQPSKKTAKVKEYFNKRNEDVTKRTVENDPIVKDTQQKQIERIEEKQKPFREKIDNIQKEHRDIIKSKTPIPEPVNDDEEPIEEEQKELGWDGDSNIKELKEDAPIESTDEIIQDPNKEIEVKIDGNVTYVKTKPSSSPMHRTPPSP